MEFDEQPNYRFHSVPSQNVVYSIFKLLGASIRSKLLGKLSRSNQPDRYCSIVKHLPLLQFEKIFKTRGGFYHEKFNAGGRSARMIRAQKCA